MELELAMEAVESAAQSIGAKEVTQDENVSKVSVVGLGMAEQTGVADRTFRSLAESGINIQMITTSEIKISALVQRDEAQKAILHLADHLGLENREKRSYLCMLLDQEK